MKVYVCACAVGLPVIACHCICVLICSSEGSCGAAPQPKKRKQSTRIQDEEPTEEAQDEIDKSMEGVEYEEDGTLWKILQVQWDADQCAMVVMYTCIVI